MGRNRHHVNNAEKNRAWRANNTALRSAADRLWQSLFWAHAAGDPVARECMMACTSGVQAVAWLADHFGKVGGHARADLLAEERFVGVKGDLFNAHEQVLADIEAYRQKLKGGGGAD